jgi:hypothetical protein
MWLGDFPEDFATVTCIFTTHDGNGAPVAPLTAFENADVIIYKNGSATQKTSQNGVTMTSPFDSITGLHCLVIDTSNDTGDSGFWTAGGGDVFTLVLSPDTETVNGQTVAKVIGQFGIELSSALRPTTARRKLDVSATGEAGLDFDNIKDATGAHTLTNITVPIVTTTGTATAVTTVNGLAADVITAAATAADFGAEVAAAVWRDAVAGDFTVANSVGKSVMNGVALGTGLTVNAVTGLTASNLDVAVSSRLAPTVAARTLDVSAGGEAGLDWANIGSPTTVVGLSGTTVKTATDVETDTQDIQSRLPSALTGAGNIKADALAFSGDTVAADNAESFFDGTGYAGTNNVIPTVTAVTGLTASNLDVAVSTRLASGSYTAPPSAATVAAAVWDALTSSLTTVGSIGKWLVDKIDVVLSTRLATLGYTAPDNTSITDIKTKTDSLNFTVPGQVDANIQSVNDVQVNGTGAPGDTWGP